MIKSKLHFPEAKQEKPVPDATTLVQINESKIDEVSAEVEKIKQVNKDRESNRSLKEQYAHYFKWMLGIQLFAMNLVFLAAGLKWISFKGYELELFMGGTLAEVFGLVAIITKHLFPTKGQH